MWNMTKMQAQALDAALKDDAAEKQRAEESARAKAKDDEDPSCSIPDDHIDPRRSALFMARSILREVREGVRAC